MTTNTNAALAEDLQDTVSIALRRAWQLGQTYWQQADSEYTSQHRKADETQGKFDALVEETRAALASAAQPERVPLTDLQIDEFLPLVVAGYSALISDDEIRAFARAVEATHGIKPAKEDKP